MSRSQINEINGACTECIIIDKTPTLTNITKLSKANPVPTRFRNMKSPISPRAQVVKNISLITTTGLSTTLIQRHSKTQFNSLTEHNTFRNNFFPSALFQKLVWRGIYPNGPGHMNQTVK